MERWRWWFFRVECSLIRNVWATLQFMCVLERALCVWACTIVSSSCVCQDGCNTPLKIHKYVAKTLIKTKSIANICTHTHKDKNKNALPDKNVRQRVIRHERRRLTLATTVAVQQRRVWALGPGHRIKMFMLARECVRGCARSLTHSHTHTYFFRQDGGRGHQCH